MLDADSDAPYHLRQFYASPAPMTTIPAGAPLRKRHGKSRDCALRHREVAALRQRRYSAPGISGTAVVAHYDDTPDASRNHRNTFCIFRRCAGGYSRGFLGTYFTYFIFHIFHILHISICGERSSKKILCRFLCLCELECTVMKCHSASCSICLIF